MDTPLTLQLLTPIYRSIQSYRAATGKSPVAICFSEADQLGDLIAVYGIPAITDLKLEPGAIDIIDDEGWAVGRLWNDGTTRP